MKTQVLWIYHVSAVPCLCYSWISPCFVSIPLDAWRCIWVFRTRILILAVCVQNLIFENKPFVIVGKFRHVVHVWFFTHTHGIFWIEFRKILGSSFYKVMRPLAKFPGEERTIRCLVYYKDWQSLKPRFGIHGLLSAFQSESDLFRCGCNLQCFTWPTSVNQDTSSCRFP